MCLHRNTCRNPLRVNGPRIIDQVLRGLTRIAPAAAAYTLSTTSHREASHLQCASSIGFCVAITTPTPKARACFIGDTSLYRALAIQAEESRTSLNGIIVEKLRAG